MKETKFTHCHRAECCDPAHPTKFDQIEETKLGTEYHCPKCGCWINFDLLEERLFGENA